MALQWSQQRSNRRRAAFLCLFHAIICFGITRPAEDSLPRDRLR